MHVKNAVHNTCVWHINFIGRNCRKSCNHDLCKQMSNKYTVYSVCK